MSDNAQSPGNTLIIITGLVLIIVALCTLGCATEIETPQQWVEGISKDMAKGVIRREIEAIEHRLLPLWASEVSEYFTEGIAGLLAMTAAYWKVRLSNEQRKKKG